MGRFDARMLLDFIREESRIVAPADIEAERLNEINFERYRDIVRAKYLNGVLRSSACVPTHVGTVQSVADDMCRAVCARILFLMLTSVCM